MRCSPEHLPAWTFEEAARLTLNCAVYREYERAQKEHDQVRPSTLTTYVGNRLNGDGKFVDVNLERVRKRWNSAIALRNEGIIGQFASGRLVTYGRAEKRVAELQLIPASAWRNAYISDWKEVRAATRRPKEFIYDVRIYPILEAPNAIERLVGMKLATAISDLIFKDPFIDALRSRTSGKLLQLDNLRSDARFLWLLSRPDDRVRSGLTTASQLANSILSLRVNRLVDYLSTVQLIALGRAGKKVGPISPELWNKADVSLDLNTGDLFQGAGESCNSHQAELLYTDLILRRPDLSSTFHVKPMMFEDARSNTVRATSKPISKAIVTLKMREKQSEACRAFLEEIIGASLTKRTHTKKEFVEIACSRWPGLSQEAALDLRKEVIKKLKAHAWAASGAPEKESIK